MPILLLSFLIGIVTGLRCMTAPAVVSWAARTGLLALGGSWLAFFGYHWTPVIFTLAAVGEIINDKLPKTPSRTIPPMFLARLVVGALCGAALAIPTGTMQLGLLLGAVGAVVGTMGGAWLRGALARAIGKDLPIALLEDAVAIVTAILIVKQLG